MSHVSVLVVHDHPVLRRGLAALLAAVDGFSVRAAGDAAEALPVLGAMRPPSVALVSAGFPALNVLLPRIRNRYRSSMVDEGRVSVALFGPADSAPPLDTWPPGVHGYLPEDADPVALGDAIRVLSSGAVVFPSGLLLTTSEPLHVGVVVAEKRGVELRLSSREREVLDLLASGHSNQQISRALGLSQGTVKSYVASIYTKTGVENRVQAALWAHGICARPAVQPESRSA